jgi:hypothetical protein
MLCHIFCGIIKYRYCLSVTVADGTSHFVSQVFSVSFFVIYFLLPVIKFLILASELLMRVQYMAQENVSRG